MSVELDGWRPSWAVGMCATAHITRTENVMAGLVYTPAPAADPSWSPSFARQVRTFVTRNADVPFGLRCVSCSYDLPRTMSTCPRCKGPTRRAGAA